MIVLVVALGCCLVWHSSAQLDLDRCYTCRGVCETKSDDRENACRCDDQCEIYGDCCGHAEERQRCNETLPPFVTGGALPTFQCHSIFVEGSETSDNRVEKAFWMVESCPTGWAGSSVEMDCKNSTMFYPVTDTNTGLVYSNEHCATCNSATDIVHWRPSLSCRTDLLILLTQEPNFTLTLEVLKTFCQPCTYTEPSTAVQARPCYHHVASCLSKDELELTTLQNFTDEHYSDLVESCTKGPYSLVRDLHVKFWLFKNQYCAVCNGFITDNLVCIEYNIRPLTQCILDRPDTGIGIVDNPFSLVLDIREDGVVIVEAETITQLVAVICSVGEVFDPVLNDCRQAVCPEGFILNEGICQLDPDVKCPGRLVALNNSDIEAIGNNTLLLNGTEYVILYQDAEDSNIVCLVLDLCTLYIALTEEDDFEYINNDTVIFNGEEHRIVYMDTLGQPVICSPFSMNGTQLVNVTILKYSYPAGFKELTYIGCSFSVLGCALILLTYSLFKELHETIPSKILMNLSFAILISNLFILLYELGMDSQDFCVATAIILHLFFLTQFSWMSIMTFEMGRTFNHARKLAHESSKAYKTKLLLIYALVGWAVPLIIVSASMAVNFTTDDLVLYGVTEDGDKGSCWINHVESALIAFVIPVALSVLFNLMVFTFISVWIYKSWRTQAKLNRDQTFHYLRIYFAVVSATGLTWVFGFLAILKGTTWSWYPFIVLNSFQGFLIFLGFVATKKIMKLYLTLLTCGKMREVLASSKHSATGPGAKRCMEQQGGKDATKLSSDLKNKCDNSLELAKPV